MKRFGALFLASLVTCSLSAAGAPPTSPSSSKGAPVPAQTSGKKDLMSAPVSHKVDIFVVDTAHSTVDFSVPHLVNPLTNNPLDEVQGGFSDFSGQFKFADGLLTGAGVKDFSLEASVVVDSINTRNSKRDGHLKSADFFEADKFKDIKFKSKRVEYADKTKFKVIGDLTIKGVTHEIPLEVEFLAADTIEKKKMVRFKASAKIKRHDFNLAFSGMKDSRILVGEEIAIRLSITGSQK